jgi:two-component system cell cycle response regulator
MEFRPPRVLIVDDDENITGLISDVLEDEGYKVAVFNSSKDVLYFAHQFQPDLLLLDIMMPEVDGCDVCRFFRNDPDLRYARILVLTARDDRDFRAKCYGAGADVFLSKPFELDELRQAVRSNINAKRAHDRVVQELREQSILDLSANCYTRKYLEKRIAEELKRLDRHPRPLSLILFDIDQFRTVNERFGYDFGNQVLKSISEAVRGQIRESDVLGRHNEDSFLLLLPETDAKGARRVSARIKQSIASLTFLTKKRLAIRSTSVILTLEAKARVEDVLRRLEEQLAKAQSLKFGKKP